MAETGCSYRVQKATLFIVLVQWYNIRKINKKKFKRIRNVKTEIENQELLH